MKKNLILPIALGAGLLLAGSRTVLAQTINIDSGSYTLNNKNDTTALLTGDVVQFGYYNAATASNPFAGTFVALTSAGGSTPTTVIGQETGNGASNGTFAYSSLNLNAVPAALPANGQIMTFVIYNNSSIAASTNYAAEADLATTWNYSSSSMFPVPQSFSMDDTGTWEGNDVGYTGLSLSNPPAAPEPQTDVLILFGSLLLAAWGWRSRRRNAPRS